MPASPEWLAATAAGRPVVVDRKNRIIRGYVVAELGPFKTPGRGQFDSQSLDQIVRLYADKPKGLKSRFTHPSLSSDGLGSFLGRSRNAYRDGNKVRADLHLAESAFTGPKGNLGGYVMDLAEEDSDALSSSLVLKTDKVEVTDDRGRPKSDKNGDPLPPIWRPVELHASDVVDTGDAVNGFLSPGTAAGELPDGPVRVASAMIDRLFDGCPREVTEGRLAAFADRYLDNRFGPGTGPGVAGVLTRGRGDRTADRAERRAARLNEQERQAQLDEYDIMLGWGPPGAVKLRAVIGFASITNHIYRNKGAELIRPGAFARYLKSGRNVRAHIQHGDDQAVASTDTGTLTLTEDSHGLYVVAWVDEASPRGGRLIRGVQSGDLAAMSIARDAIASHFDGGTRVITEAGIAEVSFCARGRNELCMAIVADSLPDDVPEPLGDPYPAWLRQGRCETFWRLKEKARQLVAGFNR
jgi:HK97 family phage prohead protease